MKLPGPLSSEPSIAVASDGAIAVAGPAGHTGGTTTTIMEGGYVWVSSDGGNTFQLRLDPNRLDTTVGACSCDTDITAIDGTLYATTMYYFVTPLFNVNVAASTDAGATWTTRSYAAGQGPLDRPWLFPGVQKELMMTYTYSNYVAGPSYSLPLDLPAAGFTIFFQKSRDGGVTWTDLAPVAIAGNHEGYYQPKPVALPPSTVIVPLQHVNDTLRPNRQNLVAVSHDEGKTFRMMPISPPAPAFSVLSFSIGAGQGNRVVAVWSAPENDTQTLKLHVRESLDSGDTWGPTRTLDIPGSAQQPWVALRPDGLLAIAYYGTDQEGPLLKMGKDTPWQPRVALVLPGHEQPFAVANLSQKPTYQGVLCNHGPLCPSDNFITPMREFLSAQWSPNGSLFVAFTDAADEGSSQAGGRITVTRLTVGDA